MIRFVLFTTVVFRVSPLVVALVSLRISTKSTFSNLPCGAAGFLSCSLLWSPPWKDFKEAHFSFFFLFFQYNSIQNKMAETFAFQAEISQVHVSCHHPLVYMLKLVSLVVDVSDHQHFLQVLKKPHLWCLTH
jgi:hypothetical protein